MLNTALDRVAPERAGAQNGVAGAAPPPTFDLLASPRRGGTNRRERSEVFRVEPQSQHKQKPAPNRDGHEPPSHTNESTPKPRGFGVPSRPPAKNRRAVLCYMARATRLSPSSRGGGPHPPGTIPPSKGRLSGSHPGSPRSPPLAAGPPLS